MEHHEGGRQNGKYIFKLVTPNIPSVVPSPYPLASLGSWIPHIPKSTFLTPRIALRISNLVYLSSWEFFYPTTLLSSTGNADNIPGLE